ncbi:MAG: FtsX-like permease family protein [Deltaproteobacteria bacterium]|nr:FtsX-like permease family protein [Deltaproteobacteria bacterium]
MSKLIYILFLIKTATNFLLRSWRSTSVLSFMIFSAVGTMVFLSALATGTNDAMIRNSVGLFSGHISGFNLNDKMSETSFQHKDVASILKRQVINGIISKNTNIHRVQLTGINPEEEKTNTGLWKKTVSGKYLVKNSKGLYIGANCAKFLNAGIGDKVKFTDLSGKSEHYYTINGIFKTGLTAFDDNKIFCDSGNLAFQTQLWNVAVFLKEGADIPEIINSFKNSSANENFLAWYEMMPDLKQLIEMNDISMGILTTIVFTILSIGVSCAFMIFVLKNLHEYGVMKSMGLSSSETVFLIFTEVFIMIFFAAAVGVLFGLLVVQIISGNGIDISSVTSHNKYFIISGIIYPRLTFSDLILPPVMSFVFCILAAAWPAYTVSTSKISKVMKTI